MRSTAGETFTFQQDNAPAHRLRDTVEYLSQRARAVSCHPNMAIIQPLWPPNSTDLNPVDYEVLGLSLIHI